MYILSLFALPLGAGLVSLIVFKKKFHILEFAILEAIVLAVLGIGYQIARWQDTSDTEIISGVITNKTRTEVSCRHSYECNCVEICSGSGKNESCTRTCQTCYEHSYDVDWDLLTNAMNHSIGIDTVDSQGLIQPPRWTSAYVGEPVAVEHSFVNYIKANPKTVLLRTHIDLKDPKFWIPEYPNKVYDYYRLNRFYAVGYNDLYSDVWNKRLSEIAGELGPTKQVEPIVLAINSPDTTFEYVVEDKWLGGKKNDLIVLLGVPHYPKIEWVRVISWSTSENLKVELRDSILNIGDMGRSDEILNQIHDQIQQKFVRRHMKDFAYLVATVEPSATETMVLFILGLLIQCGGLVYFLTNDPFEVRNY